ncbi:YifB family Mg chelatase-like AAA ATPase [Desulfuromonas thiophila]|uniref:Magnesium chelatase family protein n=1 Tax=Desulfuromonas thiophila TaxID=57664 RepID=A0A1G7DDD8_9BACT|nr:YifB family Mg chelatase-like AAA ATPase [Desulfuromonas thiophila]SDE49000.1 magnesium chelatase family protein [Desulfuromonas thiophila]
MLATLYSGALIGIDAYPVEVEIDVAQGLPQFATVGLPEGAVKECKDRVKSAIKNSGYDFPVRRITVNLAPADIRKDAASLDLPVAVGILAATGHVPERARRFLYMGELSLDGRIKPVRGCLAVAVAAADWPVEGLILPAENAAEGAVVGAVPVYGVEDLAQVVEFLNDPTCLTATPPPVGNAAVLLPEGAEDFSEVRGQQQVKRALEVAAAGSHNLLMIGPPGSGKTMLARRLPTILPPLNFTEALETTRIHSISGLLPRADALVRQRPFRSPHHSISDAGLIGGGAVPRPGEVSLAHNGVLFLDELPEFKKNLLEMLRQPLEDGRVSISRAAQSLTFPASFMLVAAMNPCPCAYLGDPQHPCRCTPLALQRYRSRLSGPLLDRIDLQVEVPRVSYQQLAGGAEPEASATIRARVETARQCQQQRLAPYGLHTNSQMQARHLRRFCALDEEGHRLLQQVTDRLGLSARSHGRILKVARTIADLAGAERIAVAHLAEAVQYRGLERLPGGRDER